MAGVVGGVLDERVAGIAAEDGDANVLERGEFDAVLSLYVGHPFVPGNMAERRFTWAGHQLPDADDLDTCVDWVLGHWAYAGRRTLVRDATGLNRPSLIAGLAMLRSDRGYSYHDVVTDIRLARSSYALSNPRYLAVLRQAA